MPDAPSDPGSLPRRAPDPAAARRKLLLIGAICVAPVLASYAFYYLSPRDSRVNYGTLLATAPAPALEGTRSDGGRMRLADFAGRWVLLVDARGPCDAACGRMLYASRQARTMQGREQDRIVRVLLVAEGAAPDAALLADHPGLVVVQVDAAAHAGLPGTADAIYVIDPLGNLVLRYDADPDIKAVSKDLTRLLKASGIG
jgi:peroxiredoxin